jgi:hypothetical protein
MKLSLTVACTLLKSAWRAVLLRPAFIPRWEVPDKVFKPLSIGTITIPAGSHGLQVTADPGIEIQAVRLKRLK